MPRRHRLRKGNRRPHAATAIPHGAADGWRRTLHAERNGEEPGVDVIEDGRSSGGEVFREELNTWDPCLVSI